MAKLINYYVEFTGTEESKNLVCSYNISGGVASYYHSGVWNARKLIADDVNVADFRYYIRVSITVDTLGRGTADIKYTVTDFAKTFDTAGSAIHASPATYGIDTGSFGMSGWVGYHQLGGSFNMLAQVVKTTNGSFNVILIDENQNQMGGSYNVGGELIVGQDAVGNYNLYAVVDGVLIKIDIIPDEIKQALIKAGVKFS
jgi:hypothetical protein